MSVRMRQGLISIVALAAGALSVAFVAASLQSCSAKAGAGTRFVSPTIGAMRLVSPGEFRRDADRRNESRITEGFLIGEREITYPQFRDVTGIELPSNMPNDTPVKFVNWYHALIFCNRLSAREGLTPVYSIRGSTDPADWMRLVEGSMPMGHSADRRLSPVVADWTANGYRLPTEMEWEWAAMGARKGSSGYGKKFAGDRGTGKPEEYAWIATNSLSSSHPVGTKKPNELGLYDMSGNVMEWCWDWFADYPAGPIESSSAAGKGPPSGSAHVVRGGSWRDTLTGLGFRCGSFPFDQDHYVGIRVARNAPTLQ